MAVDTGAARFLVSEATYTSLVRQASPKSPRSISSHILVSRGCARDHGGNYVAWEQPAKLPLLAVEQSLLLGQGRPHQIDWIYTVYKDVLQRHHNM